MAKAKRKGGPSRTADNRPGKRAKGGGGQQSDESSGVKHALLAHYYTEIKTLREYALAKLPSSSRIRRKKIASVGVASRQRPENAVLSERDATVGSILDSTLVACRTAPGADAEANDRVGNAPDLRWKQWLGFSQKGDESYVTLSDGLKSSMYSQSEVRRVKYTLLACLDSGNTG
jgi:telomerase reverse transcriptase